MRLRWPVCPRWVEKQLLGTTRRWGNESFFHRFFPLVVLLIVCEQQAGFAACRTIADLAPQGAYGIADSSGRMIDSCHPDQAMVPASVLKIATVSAALAILGPDYRFHTEFFLDRHDNLFIKGLGDPTLTSEEIATLVKQLRQKGLRRVQTLSIDTSAFALSTQVPGQEASDNPYDAPVGPLSVNFNSVPILKEVSGRIVSGESQTPTLPIMQELGKGRPAGPARINICTKGCTADTRMAQYASELFRALLEQDGVPVAALGGIRSVPTEAALFYTHLSSQTLSEVSRSTLHYSSNFMANLIFLVCGTQKFGLPATWSKAEQAVHQELVRQLGKGTADAIVQVEGSGLSRKNRVTVQVMLNLLTRFRPHIDLLKKEREVAVKTGTLTGVYNLAGYLPDGQAFVILLNQPTNTRAEVLARLVRQYASPTDANSKAAGITSSPSARK